VVRGNVSWLEMCFPVKIGETIAPLRYRGHLLRRPDVEVDGLDLGYMRAHRSVDA